jgi:hypothetical protein
VKAEIIDFLVELPGNLLAIFFVLAVVGTAVFVSVVMAWWAGIVLVGLPAVLALVILDP